MTVDADVLVVGGGPVGLAAAIEARRRGLSVVVVEPRFAPVDKACGEGLMPAASARLAALGVSAQGRPFRGIRYVDGPRSVDARFPWGVGQGVRRTVLHAALAEAAAREGAQVVAGRVQAVLQDAAGVSAAGVRARWLLGADGLHSAVRRSAGLAVATTGGRPARYGLRRHYRMAPWSDLVEVHWGRTVEAYVTPVAEDLVGVALLGPAGQDFATALGEVPQLAARLARAEPVGRVRGAGPLRQRSRSVRVGRVLLLGDAAGYVDALTGEGLAVGLATAGAAVAAVAGDRPEDYPREWARATRRYRWLTGALLATAQSPGLRPAVVPAARRIPGLFGWAVGQVGGKAG